MTAVRVLNIVLSAAGAVALILGLAMWGGLLYGLLGVHMAMGTIVVLGLWALAVMALARNVARGMAVAALVWGVATLALGPMQTHLMVGGLHWLVQVVHLLLGLGALGLGAMLAGRMRRMSAGTV